MLSLEKQLSNVSSAVQLTRYSAKKLTP